MPLYESVFIARQDISATQVEALADAFSKVIEEGGGTIGKREHWGLRALSFRIKKNRKGHYVMFNIDAAAGIVHELERQMRIHEDVLRYMTIRVDVLDEGPSAILQSRSGRDDRGRRDGRGHGGGRDGRDREGGGRDGGSRSAGSEVKAAAAPESSESAGSPAKAEQPEAEGDKS